MLKLILLFIFECVLALDFFVTVMKKDSTPFDMVLRALMVVTAPVLIMTF